MPAAAASSISTLPHESAPAQILDPLVQVVTGRPGVLPGLSRERRRCCRREQNAGDDLAEHRRLAEPLGRHAEQPGEQEMMARRPGTAGLLDVSSGAAPQAHVREAR
jgi:hypothetical protein